MVDSGRDEGVGIEKLFPVTLIVLDIGAAIVYACQYDARRAIYWLAAAVLSICVVF